jgi:tRNA(adenine34) deaminase
MLITAGKRILLRWVKTSVGTKDPKRGAIVSALQLSDLRFLNHQVPWVADVLGDECSQLLVNFFKQRR